MAQDSNRSRRGLRSAAKRNSKGTKSLKPTKALPPKRGAGGKERIFTPTNRAKAVARSNERQARSFGRNTTGVLNPRTINTAGMTSHGYQEPRNYDPEYLDRTPRVGRGRVTRVPGNNVDISFKESSQDGYERASERGQRPSRKSPHSKKLKSANVKDQLAKQFRNIKNGDYATATPLTDRNNKTSARARFYNSNSQGALKSTKTSVPGWNEYHIQARRGPNNTWVNPANSKQLGDGRVVQRGIKWNPEDLSNDLRKLAKDTPRTLVGRRAGGNSNIKARLRVNPPTKDKPRSVGAAGKPDYGRRTLPRVNRPGTIRKNGRSAVPTRGTQATQVGKRLGGQGSNLRFNRVYHGTSANAAQNIRANGYRPSPTGVFGPGVYTGNKKMAQQYADSAGRANGSGGRVLAHRVPAKGSKTVQFEKGNNPRVSPQKGLVQDRLRQGKTTRINYGNGSHVTNLTKAQADRSLIPANGQMRVTPRQQAAARRGGLQSRLSINNVQRSEPGYFKPGSRTVDTKRAADLIESQVKGMKKGGGFTVDPRTGRVPTRGTQVAVDGRVLRDTSRAGIERFVQKNKELLSRPDTKVGGWTSDRSGKPVVELSRRVRSQAEAERLGRKFQQEGVYSNQRGQVTPTGGSDQLRHTRGAQTRGGGRIGGKGATAQLRVKPQPGVVKAAARPVAKAATQSLQQQGTKQLVKGVTGTAGRLVAPALAAVDYKDRRDQGQSRVRAGGGALSGAAGGWAGAKAGGTAGATLGTAIAPGIGTAVGGLLGGALGGTAGYLGGNALHDAAYRPAPKRTQSQQEKNRLKLQRHRRR